MKAIMILLVWMSSGSLIALRGGRSGPGGANDELANLTQKQLNDTYWNLVRRSKQLVSLTP